MKDSLSYRISDKGEGNFNRSVNAAKKWIAASINGPLELSFSISLKASCPEGESVQEVAATEPMFEDNGKPKKRKPRLEEEPEFKEE